MAKFQNLSFFILIFLFSFSSVASELQGFLFKPEILSGDFSDEAPQAKDKILVYEKPSLSAKTIAIIKRNKIQNAKGKTLHLPELGYEELALPVFETQNDWYLVGLAEKDKSQLNLDGPFPVRGWVPKAGLSFKSTTEVLEDSLTELSDWDGALFTQAGGTEKKTIPVPRPKILGKARLKAEVIKKTTAKECEIPFSAKESSGPTAGICPQNFESFVKGLKCDEASAKKSYGTDNQAFIFCLDAIVLSSSNGRYQVALTEDTLDLKKLSLESGFSRDPDFGFITAWTDQKNFDVLQPYSQSESAAFETALVGQEILRPNGVEILEAKKLLSGEMWLKVKIKENCSGNDRIYGEGWLPLRSKGKIQFSTFSRGC